jgi:hypothetical protein
MTNYTKNNRLLIPFNGALIDVHDDYHRHLAVYNKKLFDPFARRQRLRLAPPHSVVTTIGQLNFMKWFIEREIDRIIPRHHAAIERHMKINPPRDEAVCIAEKAILHHVAL